MDRKRNDRITEELEIEAIRQILEENKLKWFGRLGRMKDERPQSICGKQKRWKSEGEEDHRKHRT